MKTKLFLVLAFIYFINDFTAQVQRAIGIPEYNTLYQSYDNKVFLSSNSGKVVNPTCSSAEINEVILLDTKCYLIRPGYSSRKIRVNFDIVDRKGKIIGKDSVSFSVKSFPSAMVLTTSVSKSSGAKVTVALSPDSPLNLGEYNVLSVEVTGVDNSFSFVAGNIISPELISRFKVGDSVSIAAVVKNPVSGQIEIISGFLKITN